MTLEKRLPASVIVVTSRRRTPRVAPADPMNAEIVPVLVPAEVVDLGFGGFSVETRCSLRVGATHRFRFGSPGGRMIELEAKVVHCHRKATDDWSERYVTGCEFMHDPNRSTETLVDELMDAATSALTVD
jgi:hypothetical protein